MKILKLKLQNKNKTEFQEYGNKFSAFWIKGSKIYEIDETHIRFILDNPQKFNLSKEDILQIYQKNNEKIGMEGKAREEIIRLVAKDGWIRVRHYNRPQNYWTVQFDNYRRRKRTINYFIDWALENAGMHMDDAIALLGYDDNYQVSYSTMQGGVSRMYEKLFKKKR